MLRSLYYLKKSFESVKKSREQLEDFQQRQFKEIRSVAEDLPFYREKWCANSKIQCLDDLELLPILEADKLRNKGTWIDRIIRGKTEIKMETSGSNGERASVAFDNSAYDWVSAIYTRTMLIQGYRPFQKIVQYGESGDRSWLGRKLMPKEHVHPDTTIESQIDKIEESQPELIDYFPQVLLAISKFANRKESFSVSPEVIITRGEILTPSMRNYIENLFEAPVKDQYGTTEFGIVGWECPEGGYHIAEDVVYPEFIETEIENDSEYQKIIFTGLTNPITPLVRYDMGDLVKKTSEECSCETVFTKISGIYGRKSDVFRNADNDPVYPNKLVEKIAPYEDILMYQVIAEDNRYVLKYVPNLDFNESKREECAEKLSSDLSLKPLETKEVETISRTPGGKLEIIVNNQTN